MSPSGQEAVPASPLVAPAKDSGTPTSGTCGPLFTISLRSAALNESLGSRLQMRSARVGSMVYRQTWKRKVTPAGRSYWEHTARALTISESVFTGWPTPRANNGTGAGTRGEGGENLQTAAHLAGWPTASARDYKDTPGMAETGVNPDGSTRSRLDQLPRVAQLVAGWVSPTCTDASRGVKPPREWDTGIPLTQQVSGLTPTSSDAETANTAGFQLNPRFSLWLMGFPTSWHDAGAFALRSLRERATPSCRKSRRSS